MFYFLSHWWAGWNELTVWVPVVTLFVVRASGAFLVAFLSVLLAGPRVIRALKHLHAGQSVVRDDTPSSHQAKKDTPSMGGLLVLLSACLSIFLWCDLSNIWLWPVLGALFFFALIGFYDDLCKLRKTNRGLSIRVRLLLQAGVVLILALTVSALHDPSVRYALIVPWWAELRFFLGLPLFCLFAFFVVAGTSNAVNFTDGLDGLAPGLLILAFSAFAVLALAAGNAVVSQTLPVLSIEGTQELTIVCAALVGALVGFLWYNAHPAQIFMGDVGALSLGGVLGTLALILKQELALVFIGGLFVVQALSVILQIASVRLFKRKLFLLAPLHHHFELKGLPETKVVIRFWIAASILAFLGLGSLF